MRLFSSQSSHNILHFLCAIINFLVNTLYTPVISCDWLRFKLNKPIVPSPSIVIDIPSNTSLSNFDTMDQQHREFQHSRVGELQEREIYQDQNQNQNQPHQYQYQHQYDHQHQGQYQQHHGIYDEYTTQNNLGVMLLREKRYLDAANCFCKAVKYVNERSMYHCPRHGDVNHNCNHHENGLYCDHIDNACHINHRHNHNHNQHQSQSPVSTSVSNESDDFLDFDTASLMASSIGAETHVGSLSPSNIIDSFYLLLDEDKRNQASSSSSTNININDDTTAGSHHRASHQNSSYTRYDGGSSSPPSLASSYSGYQKKCSSSISPQSSSPSSPSPSSSSQTAEETYMFRNPIIVSERGVEPTWTRIFLTQATTTESSAPAVAPSGFSSTTSSTATMAQVPAARTNTNTSAAVATIDKESCAKLSLVSVYNMALTYHLAALDNKDNNNNSSSNNGGTETAGNSNFLDKRPNPTTTNNDAVVTVNPDSHSSIDARTVNVPASSSNARPAKRQRLLNCYCNQKNNGDSTTTTTPFGECDNPYHHVNHNRFSNNNNNNSPMTRNITITGVLSNTTTTTNAVDRVLLGQALAYYEIAYRILMSEQRVLVSHAMVILNNIGHIHRLMGMEENAKRCFQRLLTTMIYLQLTGESHQISHWDSFLTNVIDLMVSQEHSHKKFAPAA